MSIEQNFFRRQKNLRENRTSDKDSRMKNVISYGMWSKNHFRREYRFTEKAITTVTVGER